ncbi:MAG TPA: YggT family protein [Patescibacteria group bacterium]|nr:YggT family protein [Patescibacteria group bacterium]
MAQTREVIRERSAGITPGGRSIVREKTEVNSPEMEDAVTIWSINRFVYYLAGVIETLLIFRFTLKILGANSVSPFVSFVYSLSAILIAPFRGIFSPTTAQGLEMVSIFEPSTIFAILVYLVLAIGIVELIKVTTATGDDY